MSRTSSQIRQEFIDFFVERGHAHVPGSPVVPHDDPTLMFTNAGMNQFKPLFLGTADPASEFGRLKRAANSQPCIRAGGKHNDLDDVGHDTYHHTFFEMLGNWSFGDYFKREAIAWAWELLTKVWGVDPRRLHATYFGGDQAAGLAPDDESRDLWRSLTSIDPSHVHPGNMKDNFWEMGDTGPCGPCSEVHIDLTPDLSGAPLVNAGDPRVMEIWNLVFIQYNRDASGRLTELPARHVDTGMGLERIASVIRGLETGRVGQVTNYDTDIFAPIFAAIQKVTGAPPYAGRLESAGGSASPDVMRDVAYRVIADHIRTLTFAITDGALPDKEGRGYVLRRILRRAVRYGWQYLNMHEPFLHKLVPAVVDSLKAGFPRLSADSPAGVIREEEASFARTLDRGIALFEGAADTARREHHGEIRGEDAFKLHDTYGFPIDLTQIMASEKGLTIDIGEYERLMEEARTRARRTRAVEAMPLQKIAERLGDERTAFVGYRALSDDVLARAVLDGQGEASPNGLGEGEDGVLVLDRTPFYAESGGQVGDVGVIRGVGPDWPEWEFTVRNTIRPPGSGDILHIGECTRGRVPPPGAHARVAAVASVDVLRRAATMANHTATHVLNWALREVLDPEGRSLQQKGSLVDPDKTRFDFSHNKPLSPDDVERIERLCNEQIAAGLEVFTNNNEPVSQADALKINGLRAVFGEKYPDMVRVVSIGVPVTEADARGAGRSEWLLQTPSNPDWRKYSIEFCGGTHVSNTRDIKRFVLASEEGVAKGVRRVVGVTGARAAQAEAAGASLLQQAQALLAQANAESATQAGEQDWPQRVAKLTAEFEHAEIPLRTRHLVRETLTQLHDCLKKLQKAAGSRSTATALAKLDDLLAGATKLGGATVVVNQLQDVPVDGLKTLADAIKKRCGSAAIFLAAVEPGGSGKVLLLAAVTDDLVKRGVKAGDWVKAIAPMVGGGGGGPPTMAQAGGRNAEKLSEAVAAADAWVRERLA